MSKNKCHKLGQESFSFLKKEKDVFFLCPNHLKKQNNNKKRWNNSLLQFYTGVCYRPCPGCSETVDLVSLTFSGSTHIQVRSPEKSTLMKTSKNNCISRKCSYSSYIICFNTGNTAVMWKIEQHGSLIGFPLKNKTLQLSIGNKITPLLNIYIYFLNIYISVSIFLTEI